MKNLLIAFGLGLLFAVGLAVAGMTQPAKVVGFLNVSGDWDPSLALVMGGALAVFIGLHRWALVKGRPFLAEKLPTVPSTGIDGRLLGGAALFGLGWGLSGFCPGPAVVAFGAGVREALIFMPAMLAGMVLFRMLDKRGEEG